MKEAREVTTRLTNRHKVRRYQVQYDYKTGEPCCVSVYTVTGGINSHWGWRAIWNRDYPLEGIAAAVVEKAGSHAETRDDMQEHGTPGEDH
jgi:hypothetical protein